MKQLAYFSQKSLTLELARENCTVPCISSIWKL
jgi:hypothetical protein